MTGKITVSGLSAEQVHYWTFIVCFLGIMLLDRYDVLNSWQVIGAIVGLCVYFVLSPKVKSRRVGA